VADKNPAGAARARAYGLFSVIGTLQLYAELTTLRPFVTAISSNWVPLMSIYQDAFMNGNLGGAAADSVLLAIETRVISPGRLRRLRRLQRRTVADF
jgi:multiple sugar transport system permease protein